MPSLSLGQSCCLRYAECSGLPVPVDPGGPHTLPGDCTAGGMSAAPMVAQTAGRQGVLVRTHSHLTSCLEIDSRVHAQ